MWLLREEKTTPGKDNTAPKEQERGSQRCPDLPEQGKETARETENQSGQGQSINTLSACESLTHRQLLGSACNPSPLTATAGCVFETVLLAISCRSPLAPRHLPPYEFLISIFTVTCAVGNAVPILQKRKLRLRKRTRFAPDHLSSCQFHGPCHALCPLP